MLLCASPAYIVTHGLPANVDEIAAHRCVNFRFASGRIYEWEFKVDGHLRVHLPGVEKRVAEELVRNTERICPYAKLTKQGIVSLIVLAPSESAGDTHSATDPSS